MQRPSLRLLFLLLPLIGLAACDRTEEAGVDAPESAAPQVGIELPAQISGDVEWADLIPAGWQPEKLFNEYDVDNLDDSDPRAEELMNKIEAMWAEAPVVEELNGQMVKLSGFIVPLEMDATEISEFLLVPYYGACIHVPPPPPNQSVYVRTAGGTAYKGEMFDTVWVEGRLQVMPFTAEIGNAAYRIEEARVSVYEEEGGAP